MSTLLTAENAAADESEAQLRQAILQAARAKSPRQRTSFGYLFAMGVVALLMVLLPIIYLALIVVVAWVAWWHLTNHYGMITPGGRVHGKMTIVLLIMYAAPGIIAGILIAFMLRPFFSRRREKTMEYSLDRKDHPFLFEFVDRLCDSVRAPRPRRIDLVDDVNAAASFRRGWWSMVTGNDLVLTLGLPVIAGLDLRQFSSILAHEFGHFTQAGGMRFRYVIESINNWFARVVFERDEWDKKLDQSAESSEGMIAWVFGLARKCVELTRRILLVLMRLGVLFSRRLARQMEFDADAVAAGFAGSSAHRELDLRMMELSHAQNAAYSALGQAYREGRLVDDLPALVVGRERLFNHEERQRIAKVSSEAKSNWYDTHPSMNDRQAAVDRLALPGVFDRREPASILFNNFEELSKRYTREFYKERLGEKAATTPLCETSRVLEAETRRSNSFRFARQFMGVNWGNWNFLPLPERTLSDLLATPVDRERIVAERKTMQSEMDNFTKGDAKLAESFEKYVACNWPKTAQQYELQVRLEKPAPTAAEVENLYDEGRRMTEPFEVAMTYRLLKGLTLRFQQESNDPECVATKERWELYTASRKLEPFVRDLMFLKLDLVPLRNFIEAAQSMADPRQVAAAAYRESSCLLGKLEPFWQKLDEVPYPFQDAAPGQTIAKVALRELPKADEVIAIYNGIQSFCEAILELRVQVAALLMSEAVEAEQGLGLEPLKAAEQTPSAATT